jgi:uncharacterized membrane protein
VRFFGETALIVFCAVIGAAGQIALKLGTSTPALATYSRAGDFQGFFTRALLSPTVMAGLLLYGASAVLWLLVLSRSQLSYAYPFVSLGFVITTLFGWQILGESMSLARLLGTILIIAGVVLVARS